MGSAVSLVCKYPPEEHNLAWISVVVINGDFDVSESLPIENLDTHADPLQQVWILDKEDIPVKVIPDEVNYRPQAQALWKYQDWA